ncbi:hypothetical protein COCOBI_07-2820 [Coccomyxa sp. Obi]|nr:hypothetical protein COCOBI_07-2820 [Coccomyxa sp. Obi]
MVAAMMTPPMSPVKLPLDPFEVFLPLHSVHSIYLVQVANLETQAKAKGTEALDSLKTKLQGTGTGGQATAAEPAAAQTEGAAPAAPAAPAADGIEGKLEQAVKAEEPKLEQEAKTELTGAGGAGTAAPAAAPAATPAGASIGTPSDDAGNLPTNVQEQVDAATENAMAVAQANLTNAKETLNEVKNEMSK